MRGELHVVLAIAQRDVVKLLRDRVRLGVSLAFPILVIAGLQTALQTGAGPARVSVLFTGVLAATLFQSSAAGMMSLIRDRETDFSRELFIAPVSRIAIVTGKVIGESLVALVQGLGVVAFGLALGVTANAGQLALLAPAALACCLLGAAFGLATLAALPDQRAALDVFPFLILPQYFLAGVITPVHAAPAYVAVLSWAMPLRYVVDLTRATFYMGSTGYSSALMESPAADAAVVGALFLILLLAGGFVFDRRERYR